LIRPPVDNNYSSPKRSHSSVSSPGKTKDLGPMAKSGGKLGKKETE
jgi:hypothetical protein